MLIYSTLWLSTCHVNDYNSENSGVRLVQAWTNVRARRENETVFYFTVSSVQFVVAWRTVCVFAVYFYFVVRFTFFLCLTHSFCDQHVPQLMAIHLNQCMCATLTWKETDWNGKRCVCWWWFLSCFFSVFTRVSIGSRRKSWRIIFDFFPNDVPPSIPPSNVFWINANGF